jgi:hypothetical protein
VPRILATTLTLQEDFPKGSKVEAWLRGFRDWAAGTAVWSDPDVELVPIRTEPVGVTEDKGAELSMKAVPVHIPEGSILVLSIPVTWSLQQRSEMNKVLTDAVRYSRAVAGVMLPEGSKLSAHQLEELAQYAAD